LVGWLLAARFSVGQVFAGYLGYLGAIPIALGLRMLVDLLRRHARKIGAPSSPAMQSVAVSGIVLTTLSNGVDSVLVFAPLLADSLLNVGVTIAIAFMLMVYLRFELAKYATTRAKRVKVLKTAGEWVAPIVMIFVVLYILDNTVADVVVGS